MDDKEAIAKTCWGEARGEGFLGMKAVANVIMNRVALRKRWGITPLEVCLKPDQFSCWRPSDANFQKLKSVTSADSSYARALSIAAMAVDGLLDDITNGATHYKVIGTPAKWAQNQEPVSKIGRHEFYKLTS